MIIVGDDVVVKYTLSKKIVERFSTGRDEESNRYIQLILTI